MSANNNPLKRKLRDATLQDIPLLTGRIKNSTTKYFGSVDLLYSFKIVAYSLITETECKKMVAYAQFESHPNIEAVPRTCWLHWIRHLYGMKQITYGNTLFLTFLMHEDPYDPDVLRDIFKEMFIREPKIRYICTVAPPIDSIYEDILAEHCERVYSVDQNISRLNQSLFVCERYRIIKKMRLRRALAEDNDDIIEIIDEYLPLIRRDMGDFYIAEQVLENDPCQSIVVAEIGNTTVGMMWLNTNIHRKALADNFEISSYGNFLRPDKSSENVEKRLVVDVLPRRSSMFFEKRHSQKDELLLQQRRSEDNRLSLNNLYELSSDPSSDASSDAIPKSPSNIVEKWQHLGSSLKSEDHYNNKIRRDIVMPKKLEVTNAFALQLFGLSKSIDPRRIFDLIEGAFAAYPEKDYCIFSLSSSEASYDSLSGRLLKYFSRVVRRPACKISDCLYVTHKNSFLAEIELDYLTFEDIPRIDEMLCHAAFKGLAVYSLADIMQRLEAYLNNPWSPYCAVIMRIGGCTIGFAILWMCEIRANYIVYDDMDAFSDWRVAELKYLHLHPAFEWEWTHITREIFRLTGFVAMHYKLYRRFNYPVLNSILMNMFPLFPRKRVVGAHLTIDPYALYYLNIKMCHMKRDSIENKIVIVGFNEVCKGFLRSLIYSDKSKHIRCLNIVVITDCPGYIEAEHDISTFPDERSFVFPQRNQFDANYLRRLEFRTWVGFIQGRIKGFKANRKRIIMENGTTFRYDRLYLMCSSRYCSPKQIIGPVPANYMEVNYKLEHIIFYLKIKLLITEIKEHKLPILVYGFVATVHSCISALLELGIPASQIFLILPPIGSKHDFPETIEDEYVMNFVFKSEKKAGINIYKDLKFHDWTIKSEDNTIESVTFEAQFERVTFKCLAFISFHTQSLSYELQQTMEESGFKTRNNKLVINEYCKTSLPFIYACGRITQYEEALFASQIEQKYYNQIDVGNQLAMNFIHERQTGQERSILDATFSKPIFRQTELLDGVMYAGLRKPGRHVPRDIRKHLNCYGTDLITSSEGEYCRLCIDENGFVSEITCFTRKYKNLELLYRIYGLHDSLLNNMRRRCQEGQIKNLLDYFFEESFAVIIHDKFVVLRGSMRERSLAIVKDFLKGKNKIDKREIQEHLKNQGMHEAIQKDLSVFIKKHWLTLHPHYALPEDFLE